MKKVHLSLPCLLLFIVSTVTIPTGKAQNFKLIDVNKTRNSNPNNYQFSNKNTYADLNGVFYFQAEDGAHGVELYKSDGTAGGTSLVKDLNPGTSSSYPYDIVTSGGKIFFAATDNKQALKLWVSNGTSAGTTMLDVLPKGVYSDFRYLTDVNGTLYLSYAYTDSSNFSYTQIWKSDGTTAGTTLVSNRFGYIGQMVNVSGKLFFTSYDYTNSFGLELYTSDGTSEGTVLVKDINPNFFAGSDPSLLTPLSGRLYFAANDGSGIKLFVSDGTAAGTFPVKNEHNIYLAGAYLYERDTFAIINNTLYFQGYAFDSTTLAFTGNELCKFNTSDINSSVALVKDINPGAGNSYPGFITNVNNTLYFTIGPDSADAQLWKSDGTAAGTALVKDINPGGQNNYYGLTDAGGTLLFAYGNDSLGTELWKSNGTATGTVLVKDILPGPSSSYPGYFTYKYGIFIFGANGAKGSELWRSDGTAAGTAMVKDINYKSTGSSFPYGFSRLANNKIIFSASDGKTRGNLIVTDGTNSGTKPLGLPVYGRQLFTSGQEFVTMRSTTYFLDDNYRLWKTKGTKASTSMLPIPAFADYQTGYVSNLVATDSLLYIFTYNYLTSNTVLWRTDGTAAGTFVLKTNLNYFYYLYPTAIGNTLFYAGSDPNTGAGALWKTDGSVQGTVVIKTLETFGPPANLSNFKGKLYFSAYTPTNNFGPSLWISDGTAAGTGVLKDVALSFEPFAQANGKLFFYALDRITYGYELFASDGTKEGTEAVKDINEGPASSSIFSLIGADTLLYFLAHDPEHGHELWKSNGKAEGTKLIKDITPGPDGSSYGYMVAVHNSLFFTIHDTLWQSDGREGDTHPVEDNNLKGVTQIGNPVAIGDSLYFSGYKYNTGQELYIGGAEIKAPLVTLSVTDSGLTYTGPAIINLHADAVDGDGNITGITLYNDATALFTDTQYPYDFSWTGVPAGKYKFTARATDNSGNVSTSDTITVIVTDSAIVPSLEKISRPAVTGNSNSPNSNFSLKLSPIPAKNILQISASWLQPGRPSKISILSATGVVLKSMQSNNLNQVVQLDVSSLLSGVYTLKVGNGDKFIYRQFVKLR